MTVNDPEACRWLVARIIQQAVEDAGDSKLSPAERGEALDWIQDGGLRWACRWLDLDRDWLLWKLEAEGRLEGAGVVRLPLW